MKGYLGEGAEGMSSTIDSEGWLKMGDLCYVDNEGFLYVPLEELAELLLSHPDILDAVVIPYPDEEAGEVPMAFVVRKPQTSIDKTQTQAQECLVVVMDSASTLGIFKDNYILCSLKVEELEPDGDKSVLDM